MPKETITLSNRELDRVSIILDIVDKRLRQSQGAQQLDLSVRQVGRLVQRYKEAGPSGLVSGHRGKRSNHAMDPSTRAAALEQIRERYPDFGPTPASEKLREIHDIPVSRETLRQWMIAEELWKPRGCRKARVHQRRLRRLCFGELVQIDGSPHDWFEGRAESLIVFIDDATSRLGGACDLFPPRLPRPTWRLWTGTWTSMAARWLCTVTDTASSG